MKMKMIIDLRQMALLTLWKKHEKKLLNENTKQAIRDNDIELKFNDYAKLQLKNYTKSYYNEKDQAEIDEFIKSKGFKKITETKENYSVEIVPSEKAINEFNKMLTELEQSQHKNIAKVASKVRG